MWETPQWLFNELDREFHFNIDLCAVNSNKKCEAYFSPQIDSLSLPWCGSCWCNPPYGRNITQKWVRKASESVCNGSATRVVMLLPARTDTRWFHDYIYDKPNTEIRFLKGRLKFGNCKNSAPFPSMVVVFNKNWWEKL
jgi:phage N-6-adenine-methyltransferase